MKLERLQVFSFIFGINLNNWSVENSRTNFLWAFKAALTCFCSFILGNGSQNSNKKINNKIASRFDLTSLGRRQQSSSAIEKVKFWKRFSRKDSDPELSDLQTDGPLDPEQLLSPSVWRSGFLPLQTSKKRQQIRLRSWTKRNGQAGKQPGAEKPPPPPPSLSFCLFFSAF